MEIKEVVALTDAGQTRQFNEDAFLRMDDIPLFAVADGMGGAEVGKAAAQVALMVLAQSGSELQTLGQEVEKDASSRNRLALSRALEEVIEGCHEAVSREAEQRRQPKMATTLLAATIAGNQAFIGHVGNCRAYLYRDDELLPLTDDHTVAMFQYRRGRLAADKLAQSPLRERLYQALGVGSQPEVDIAEVSLINNDILLLCSDGLTRAISDEQIAATLHRSDDLSGAAQGLITAANAAGGPDNITVVLAQVEAPPDPEETQHIAQVLRQVFLFRDLGEPERLLIAPYLEKRLVPPGTVVAQEGELADDFFVVVNGRVRISHGALHLVDIGPGGHFGELALARPNHRSATVTALDMTTLYSLSRKHFQTLVRARPDVGARLALALLDTVGDRMRALTDRLLAAERPKQADPSDLPDPTDLPDPSDLPDPTDLPQR